MADDLRTRESVRRKALWTLSHLMPGDPKAAAILDVLDDIEEPSPHQSQGKSFKSLARSTSSISRSISALSPYPRRPAGRTYS